MEIGKEEKTVYRPPPSKEYALVFQSQVVDGFTVAQVKNNFIAMVGCDVAKAEALFTGRRLIFKRFATEDAANRAAERLRQIGMVVEIVATERRDAPVPTASPNNATSVPASSERSVQQPLTIKQQETSSERSVRQPLIMEQQATPLTEAPQAPSSTQERRIPFVFSGSGGEFFKIWIVNVFFTICTLGIWSAWAKVRTMRYFYGNTSLDGSAFEYLAEPVKILKGRLIVFAFFVASTLISYLLQTYVGPEAAIVFDRGLSFAVLAITPWVIWQSLRFSRHYSSWRGLRFGFDGDYKDAIKAFLLWPMLSFVPFVLPVIWQRQTRYLVDNSRYGGTHLQNASTTGNFRGMYIVVALLFLLCWFLIFNVIGIIRSIIMVNAAGDEVQLNTAAMTTSFWVMLVGLLCAAVLCYLLMIARYAVTMANLRWGKTDIGPHSLECTYTVSSYTWLILTNFWATMLTLGLFYPFARVRKARYAASHMTMVMRGDLDRFVAKQRDAVSALGGEAADFLDIDIGF
jgi:Predicted membrane protein